MEDELTSLLYDLLDQIESKVNEEREDLPEVDIEYSRFAFEKYDYELYLKSYHENEPIDDAPFEITQEKVTESEISNDVKNDRIISDIEEKEIYNDVKSVVKERIPEGSVEEETNVSEHISNESEKLVNRFVERAVDNLLDGSLDSIPEREKASLAAALTRETSDSENCYETTIWIAGLATDFEEKIIDDHTKLIRPKQENLTQRTRADQGIMTRLGPYRPPSLAVKHKFWADSFLNVQEEFETVLNLIRLYSGTSALIVGYEIKPQSILRDNFKYWADSAGENNMWPGILEESDDEPIHDFYTVVEAPFRERISNTDKQNYISISFDRFENAAIYDETIEESIASTIMSLEALYLKENEQAELSERLAQRTGALLGYFDYEPVQVYERIKAGYDVRSSYVHGTKSSDDFSSDLGKRTLSFARQSIISHLQLIEKYEKDELVSKLDNAIMSRKAREDFEQEINDICSYKPQIHNS